MAGKSSKAGNWNTDPFYITALHSIWSRVQIFEGGTRSEEDFKRDFLLIQAFLTINRERCHWSIISIVSPWGKRVSSLLSTSGKREASEPTRGCQARRSPLLTLEGFSTVQVVIGWQEKVEANFSVDLTKNAFSRDEPPSAPHSTPLNKMTLLQASDKKISFFG